MLSPNCNHRYVGLASGNPVPSLHLGEDPACISHGTPLKDSEGTRDKGLQVT